MRDHQEGTLLKQDDFICSNRATEPLQRRLKLVDVGQEDADDLGPGLVKCFVPDRGTEALRLVFEVLGGGLHDATHLLVEHLVTQVLPDQVHLVDQHENLGVG